MATIGGRSHYCQRCGEYLFDNHRCLPLFLIWHADDSWTGPQTVADGKRVYAASHEAALEKFAEHFDAGGDYIIVGGTDMTFFVKKHDEEEALKFTVSGRTEAVYTARPVT